MPSFAPSDITTPRLRAITAAVAELAIAAASAGLVVLP